jgi:hypothetical protein
MERKTTALPFNFGTFEGFNFRSQSAVSRILSAEEVLSWDHDEDGEAEFWPAGDCPGLSLVFSHRSAVSASELVNLASVLERLGGDSEENYLRLHYAINVAGEPLHTFLGDSFLDLRRNAAYELFELYYPELYRVWESSLCDGLIFDTDAFLDSPSWSTEEAKLGCRKALIVCPG